MIYCKNCGNEVHEQAVMCTACGVPPWKGRNFCYNCKAATDSHAEICTNCGVNLQEGKDWMATLLLCVLLGYLGIHRFYTGDILIGVLQLLTLGGCGIWTLIDLVLILTDNYKDANGKLLRKK